MFNRLALGDETALNQIVDEYGDALIAYTFRIVHDYQHAEEIKMDVLLELWERRQQVALMKYPTAWLFKVARNKAIDLFRKESSHLTVSLEALTESANEIGLEDEILLRETKSILASAIDQLPPQEKRIYKLSTEEGWHIKDIAELLKRSPNTIRNELAIARVSLKKIISYYLHLLFF